MRVGCKKGKGTAAEALLETEETLLEGAKATALTEDIADAADDGAVEETVVDNTLDTAWELEIAEEEKADEVILSGEAFF